MIVFRELARAKVNLFLHVTGKRDDGYHLLESLVAFANIGDLLEAKPAAGLSLTVRGNFAAAIDAKENSVLRAAEALRRHSKVSAGAAITLYKNLPVGAGIGGGSADAAATLRVLARLWKLRLSPEELAPLALALGADVPACLHSSGLLMRGIGEIVDPRALPELHAVLANPGKPLLTASVFARYKAAHSAPVALPLVSSMNACVRFLQQVRNDLETPAQALMPEIGEALAALSGQEGCVLSRMSGSGATCFGLFAEAKSAQAATQSLQQRYPEWWVKAAVLQ